MSTVLSLLKSLAMVPVLIVGFYLWFFGAILVMVLVVGVLAGYWQILAVISGAVVLYYAAKGMGVKP